MNGRPPPDSPAPIGNAKGGLLGGGGEVMYSSRYPYLSVYAVRSVYGFLSVYFTGF